MGLLSLQNASLRFGGIVALDDVSFEAEDGTIFGLPDTHVQLEIVRGRGGGPTIDPLDLLVLYLPGEAAVAAATEPLRRAGVPTDPSPHPYWVARGGTVHLDPDGRRVVFAPWVYGHEPEPTGP